MSASLLAGIAIYQEPQSDRAAIHARPNSCPALPRNVKNAARIHVVSHSGSFDVSYSAAKGWVLPAQGQLSRRLRPGAPHSARPGGAGNGRAQDRARRLAALSGVWTRRPKAMACEIIVSDAAGHDIAGAHHRQYRPDRYRRKRHAACLCAIPATTRAILPARSSPRMATCPIWVDTNVMSVDAARVNSVDHHAFLRRALYRVARACLGCGFQAGWPAAAKGLAASTSQIDLRSPDRFRLCLHGRETGLGAGFLQSGASGGAYFRQPDIPWTRFK